MSPQQDSSATSPDQRPPANRIRLSPKQVAASATGAVLAALIASFFGEKGTIVGIAIGSVVATTATALVMQSLERTQMAMRQAVQSSDRTAILRRLGSSRPVGSVSEATEPSPVTGHAPESSPGGDLASARVDDGVAGEGAEAGGGDEGDRRLVASAHSGGRLYAPAVSSTRRGGGADQRDGERPRISWRVLAASVGLVFVLALLAVTAVELLVGKPLASWVGSSQSNHGTTLSNLGSSPTTTTVPPTTTAPTSTSTTTSTTTSTVAPASTTTTGVATGSTTTSTSSTTSTTTTTTTTKPPTSPPPGTAGGG